jgi:N-dimethylarginine dimethylaminohydrolase
MCWNEQYQVNYDINPWMDDQFHQVNGQKAHGQWEALRELLVYLEARVEVLEINDPLIPDIVFTANAGVIHDNIFIPSKFRYKERDPEVEPYVKWFIDNTEFNIQMCPATFEGAGDALKDVYGNMWMGHGFRSSLEASKFLTDCYPSLNIHTLKLINPSFYHLDTCFCPLSSGYLMVYPKAFSNSDLDLMKYVFGEKIIEVSDEDARKFACNAVEWAGNIIINGCSPSLNFRLEDAGYNVIELDLSEFIKAGGSAKCLTIRLS